MPRPRFTKQIRDIGGWSQGMGGATTSALLVREKVAPGPVTQALAPQAPSRPGREDASEFGGATL